MLAVASWKTPFDASSVTGFVPAPEVRADFGEVLLVRLSGCPGDVPDAEALPGLVGEIRSRHPGSPVALWISEVPLQVAVDAVRAAVRAQIRAVLGGDALDPELLRHQLTHPLELSAFILRWASDAGYLPPGLEQEDVRELLDAEPDVRTLHRLSVRRQVAARTWRKHLQQLGLPNPHAWLALTHALHVAFFLQRNSTLPLQVLADRLGMHTVPQMTQQFRRVFGLAPGQVRDLLGAEPLLHRWFQRRAPR
jgi:hypothetical protein